MRHAYFYEVQMRPAHRICKTAALKKLLCNEGQETSHPSDEERERLKASLKAQRFLMCKLIRKEWHIIACCHSSRRQHAGFVYAPYRYQHCTKADRVNRKIPGDRHTEPSHTEDLKCNDSVGGCNRVGTCPWVWAPGALAHPGPLGTGRLAP